ncbi:MAG: hypothetical protein HG453_003845 [Clostridiales bacterium]|nr:hypothetical protein [Clostridiales bacterium]
MKVYEILFIAGFVLLILGMIPIFYGFIKTIFEMIADIKNHDYDMLPELLLSLGVIAMLAAVILNVVEK